MSRSGDRETEIRLISYAASTLPASSRPVSIIFLASASSRAQSTASSIPRLRPRRRTRSLVSEKHLDPCHISSCSHMTASAEHLRDDPAHAGGYRVHHGVHDLLGEPAQQLLHVDGTVVEPGHEVHVRSRA